MNSKTGDRDADQCVLHHGSWQKQVVVAELDEANS